MDVPSFGEILDPWKLLVLQIANAPDKQPLFTRIRDALDNVLKGGTGDTTGGPSDFRLPGLSVRALRRRSVLVADLPNIPERTGYIMGADRWVIDGQHEELRQIESQLLAVVMTLPQDPRARPLRRCDWKECRIFFFARADHRREHSFCSEGHRRAYDLAHRDKAKMAKYMRKHRADKAAEARRRKSARRSK